jgi:hypothetical protein
MRRYRLRTTADTRNGCVMPKMTITCLTEDLPLHWVRYDIVATLPPSNLFCCLLCFPNSLLIWTRKLIMAPSKSLLVRFKNALRRTQAWRPNSKAVPNQASAIPTKVSIPEQPQAAKQQPIIHQDQSSVAATSTMPTLQIALTNNTTSDQAFAYIS